MKSLTIKTHSSDRREHEFFQAILTLAGSVLTHEWRLVDAEPADVVMISFASDEPYSAWDEHADKYPPERLVAYTDEPLIIGAKWHLRRAPGSMPRLGEVVKILNSVARHLGELDTAPPTRPLTAEEGRFHPRHHLAGALRQAQEEGRCLACSRPGGPAVYVCPPENAVYTAAGPMELSALCRTPIDHVNMAELRAEELREEVAAMEWVRRRTLPEFLWFSILTGSNGRILPGCRADEPVHLKEWPGHARLPFYSMYHDIATHMAAGMATLGEIARNSGAPLQNVIDFHNACESQGLIARGEEGNALAGRKRDSRERLRQALHPHCADNGHLKLVLVGSVGAGKTTALTALSETPPVLTEASPSDAVAALKPTTTVAMEYGELRIAPGAKLQIYSTPGQRRFDFMGQILRNRAWGLLILIDNTEPHPLADLKYYIDLYADGLDGTAVAIGISHYDDRQTPSLEDYRNFLSANRLPFALGVVDTRDIQSLTLLIAAMGVRPAHRAARARASWQQRNEGFF